MQEIRNSADGQLKQKLTDAKDMSDEKFRAALDKLGSGVNRTVALHAPGTIIEHGDRKYRVDGNGSWRRVRQ